MDREAVESGAEHGHQCFPPSLPDRTAGRDGTQDLPEVHPTASAVSGKEVRPPHSRDAQEAEASGGLRGRHVLGERISSMRCLFVPMEEKMAGLCSSVAAGSWCGDEEGNFMALPGPTLQLLAHFSSWLPNSSPSISQESMP